MPRDATTPADPLVIVLQDMGAHGLDAEVYPLSYAIDCAADHATGDSPFEVVDMRYLEGDRIGEPVARWQEIVREEVQERDREAVRSARGIFW